MRLIPGTILVLLFTVGCESEKPTTQPTSLQDRQSQQMRDPMGYRPDFTQDRISSGSMTDFDKKGFQKDMDSVFNP